MEEFITATIVAVLFYAALRFFKIFWLRQNFPASFIHIAGIFAWFAVLALLASVYSLVSLIVDVTASPAGGNFAGFTVILIVLGASCWLLFKRRNVLDIRHMIPFLRSALLFQTYDARRQEMLERNELIPFEPTGKAAKAEPSPEGQQGFIDISEGTPFTEDANVGSTKVIQESTIIDQLRKGETTDITELFASNTSRQPSLPLVRYIGLMRINPSERLLGFNLVLPTSVTGDEITREKLQMMKQGIHDVLQTIIAERWLAAFLPFFDAMKATCFRTRKDDFDMTQESAFLSVQINVMRLRLSAGKSFDITNFENNATITMLE